MLSQVSKCHLVFPQFNDVVTIMRSTFSVVCGYLWQHLFALEGRDELMKHVQDAAANNVGVSVKQRKEPITFDQYQLHRLGKYRQDGSHRICIWSSVEER